MKSRSDLHASNLGPAPTCSTIWRQAECRKHPCEIRFTDVGQRYILKREVLECPRRFPNTDNGYQMWTSHAVASPTELVTDNLRRAMGTSASISKRSAP